jgi:ATP synthase F1 gamma subunit
VKPLSVLKKDLEFNKGLSSLIEVLKNIAVSQYRALEKELASYEKLLLVIESFLSWFDINQIKHPFLDPKDKPQAVIAVTSDSGLLGGLNMHVVTSAILELNKIPGKLIVIGECGKLYARETNIPFVTFGGISDEARYGQAMQMRDYVIEKFAEGSIGHLKVVYPRPISFTVQRVEVVPFLPFKPPISRQTEGAVSVSDIIFESRHGDIIEYLVYLWMAEKLYEIFGLSRLAEFAARFVHLEESSQKLKDMDEKLKLQYFRARHELIDRNMRELFSARLLYASKH